MAVPTFSNKLPLTMKRGRNRRPGTSSSSTAGSRVLKLELHAEEEDSVSEVSDGNGCDAAVEDDGPIQLLNDLLLYCLIVFSSVFHFVNWREYI